MLARDTPSVSSISGMVMPPSRPMVLASQRGSSRSQITSGKARARLMMMGLASSRFGDRSLPDSSRPRLKCPTESTRKKATASARPFSPKA
ncbi:hypothetical protein D3C84_1151110 [compost metagenome]